MKIIISNFIDTMTRPQRIAGFIYLPLHVLVLPILLGMAAYFLPGGLSLLTSNILYYAIGFSFCLLCFWSYLRQGYDRLLDRLGLNIVAISMGYLINIVLGLLVSGLLVLVLGDEAANPNNELVLDVADLNPRAMMGLAVFAAPVVEEILFRGVLFGSIRPKSRFWAFAVSILAFGFYHVWQLALADMDWRILIYALQYIPVSYALGWVYEKTGSIWAPIFLHMINNGLAMLVLS